MAVDNCHQTSTSTHFKKCENTRLTSFSNCRFSYFHSRQYIGEHIRCIVGKALPVHVVETFCFFTSTFTVIKLYNESMLQSNMIAHPGVGPHYEDDGVIHHAYYQWVPFVLFSQCLMFYATHLLWKNWEGGKIKQLVDGLHMIALSKYVEAADIEVGGKKVPARKTVENKVRDFFGSG